MASVRVKKERLSSVWALKRRVQGAAYIHRESLDASRHFGHSHTSDLVKKRLEKASLSLYVAAQSHKDMAEFRQTSDTPTQLMPNLNFLILHIINALPY